MRQYNSNDLAVKEKCKNLIRILGSENEEIKGCQVGKSMIFYRPEQNVLLEVLRAETVEACTNLLQRVTRGFISRVYVSHLKRCNMALRNAIDGSSITELEEAMQNTKIKQFEWLPNFLEAASRLKHLKDVEKVNRALNTIQTLDPIKNFDELKDVVDTAEHLGINNDSTISCKKTIKSSKRFN